MPIRKILFLILIIGWIAQPLSAQQANSISFEHIFDGDFTPRGIQNINWMKDGRYYTTLERTSRDIELRKYDVVTGEYEIVVSSTDLVLKNRHKPILIQGYQFSADEQKILIKSDVEPIWRRSTRENYFIYDIQTGKLNRLTESGTKQRYAKFSPTGDKVAFVRENDLFWVDIETGEENAITTDGAFNKIINGAADWVYEEEFGIAKAWYWSPDGEKIAFYRFDESRVKEFVITEWEDLYPGLMRFKYPKAGEENSVVKIGIYDLKKEEVTWMDIGSGNDQYIPRINWTKDPNTLAIRRMNRLQNKQDLMLANVSTGETEIIKTETSNAWIDVNDNLKFLDDGEHFIYTSEESGFNHIYLYKMNGELVRQITKGDWEVTNFVGYDGDSGKIYYVSTEVSPLQRHLYSINIDGTGKRKISDGEGWNNINMSRDYKFYIETFSNSEITPKFTLHTDDGEKVRTLVNNTVLKDTLSKYQIPKKEYVKIPLRQATLNAYILKPHDFDPEKKYPVLFYVYGGPGSQTVTKSFASGQRAMWHRYLTEQGYIVVSIDNRGTGGRGRDFEKQIYRKLGQYEVQDQIDAAKYLTETYNYLDEDRLGIWGWSYGGFLSTLALAKGSEVFKTAIAVAPVTNWRYYDTIYTERFMQTPKMNSLGYQKGAPVNYADQIEGDYLLVHGTSDDNVHFQNTVEFVDKLVKAGVQFETMFYPNKTHGIYGGNTRKHLFKKLNSFILENL